MQYFPNGAIKQFTYGNGIVHTMVQNARQLPASSTDTGGALSQQFTYDRNGNVTVVTDALDNARSKAMGYDDLDRLTSASAPIFGGNGVHEFAYDPLDNLRSWKLAGVKDFANYVYDANNRLAEIRNTGGDVVHAFGYDVQGNVVNKDSVALDFDYGNRLREVTGQEYYRYDGMGRRVLAWRPSGGNTMSMYTQSGQVAYQESEPLQKRTDHIYLSGSLVATREVAIATGAVTTKYQHTDALGSPVAISNEAGAVVERTNYDPYGGAIGKVVEGVGYTGHVMDPATGLTYMQQRYYDQSVGRFMSVDPIATNPNSGQGFNVYQYAANNPFRYFDPDGRKEDEKYDRRSMCRTKSCDVGGSGGRSRAETGQDRDFARAKKDPSVRQSVIDRMHAASGLSTPSPTYDPNLVADAGAVDTIDGSVTVGPSAFDYENAADLGSVIFHESIHYRQFQAFGDFQVMALDNRDHVLEHEAHSRTLSRENPFYGRMSKSYRAVAEKAIGDHIGSMNATNRAVIAAGGTCATSFCSGGK